MLSQRIVRVFDYSISQKSYRKEQRSLSPTDMTAVTTLSKVIVYTKLTAAQVTLSVGL